MFAEPRDFYEPTITPIDEITIKPVNWFLLIRERTVARRTDGGVLLPDQAMHGEQVLSYYGEVVAMGPNCFKHAKFSGAGMQCKVGDWVVIGRYAGQKMQLRGSGEIYRMITDDMIMGVTTDPNDLVVYAVMKRRLKVARNRKMASKVKKACGGAKPRKTKR